MSTCHYLENLLADREVEEILQQSEVHDHIVACPACRALLRAMEQVDRELAALPVQMPSEVSTRVALEAVTRGDKKASLTVLAFPLRWNQLQAGAALAACAAIAFVGVQLGGSPSNPSAYEYSPTRYNDARTTNAVNALLTYAEGSLGALMMAVAAAFALITLVMRKYRVSGAFATAALSFFMLRSMTSTFFNDEGVQGDEYAYAAREQTSYNDQRISTGNGLGLFGFGSGSSTKDQQAPGSGEDTWTSLIERFKGDLSQTVENAKKFKETLPPGVSAALHTSATPLPANSGVSANRNDGHKTDSHPESEMQMSKQSRSITLDVPTLVSGTAPISGLELKDPTGYWENTYVPGDPLVLKLQSLLKEMPESYVSLILGGSSALEHTSVPVDQPFDAPKRAAIGLNVHADKTAISGPARLLLQIGLKAAKRLSGTRPPMTVTLVLDVRGEIGGVQETGFAALLAAMLKQKQPGDRFNIVVAGKPGGHIISHTNFRLGQVEVAQRALFGPGEREGESLSLAGALDKALALTSELTSDTAHIGSSVILLATAQPLGSEAEKVTEVLHAGAVDGINTSVVSIGQDVNPQEMDALVLAGHGNRRTINEPGDAEFEISRELTSLSRVVARAVRLKIKLAPGVELIDVLGSRRLDEPRAQAVREAEQSIDRRVKRSLGIEADRSSDEDGIQILVPALYAGDSHVILLDVVVRKPGPVAEVAVRYKDLVNLSNGTSLDSFSLENGDHPRGALETNVLQNLLAFQLSQDLMDASKDIASGGNGLQPIERAEQRIEAAISWIPELALVDEITSDRKLVQEYSRALRAATNAPPARQLLEYSLLLAAKQKLLPVNTEK